MRGWFGFWRKQQYHLNKMTLAELIVAYFQYYAIQTYIVLGVVCTVYAVRETQAVTPVLLSAAAAVVMYPMIWYLLHRYVLHGKFLFRSPITARVWKRVHYDHHQDPHNLEVLFGALYTTLPTLLLITAPVGWAIGGMPAALSGVAAGLVMTCLYEFCHCIQHLSYKPRWKFLRKIKMLHMAHHFHNEQGNFGITNFFWDRLFSTYYNAPSAVDASTTVFNLGYTDAQAELYPWVARLAKVPANLSPRERRRRNASK